MTKAQPIRDGIGEVEWIESIGYDNALFIHKVLDWHKDDLKAVIPRIVIEAEEGFKPIGYQDKRVNLLLQLHMHIATEAKIPADLEREMNRAVNFTDTVIAALISDPREPCKPWDFYPDNHAMALELAYGVLKSVHRVFGEYSEQAIKRRVRVAEVSRAMADKIQELGKASAHDADAERAIRINAADTFPALERACRQVIDLASEQIRQRYGEAQKGLAFHKLIVDEPVGGPSDKPFQEYVRVRMDFEFLDGIRHTFGGSGHDIANMLAAVYWNHSGCYLNTPEPKDRNSDQPIGRKRTLTTRWSDGSRVKVAMSASRVVLMNDGKKTPHFFTTVPVLDSDKCWTDESIRQPKQVMPPHVYTSIKEGLASLRNGRNLAVEGDIACGKLTMVMDAAKELGAELLVQTFPTHHKLMTWDAGKSEFRLNFMESDSAIEKLLRKALAEPTKLFVVVVDELEKAAAESICGWFESIDNRQFILPDGTHLPVGDNVRFVVVGPVGIMGTLCDAPAQDRWLRLNVPSVNAVSTLSERGPIEWVEVKLT